MFLESIQDTLVTGIEALGQGFSENISGIMNMWTTKGLIILLMLSEAMWMRVPVSYTHLDVYKRQPFFYRQTQVL